MILKIELERKLLESLIVMGSVIEARDPYTGGHVWRVSQYAKYLSTRMGLSQGESFVVQLGAMLHDLGKIAVPDAILSKPGRLTEEEYAIIKIHPSVGRDVITPHPLSEIVVHMIAHHHERVDGKGYPDGLYRDMLTRFARIVAISDAFDAMTSTRPYRKGMPVEQALAELDKERDKQFDGEMVSHFLDLYRDGTLTMIIGHSDHGRSLAVCRVCGPTMAVPRTARDGDIAFCPSCRSKYQLHLTGDRLEVEFQNERSPHAKPVIDHAQISAFVLSAPGAVGL